MILIPALGFSRGAYQVRVIAGMIEKVRLAFQFDRLMAHCCLKVGLLRETNDTNIQSYEFNLPFVFHVSQLD